MDSTQQTLTRDDLDKILQTYMCNSDVIVVDDLHDRSFAEYRIRDGFKFCLYCHGKAYFLDPHLETLDLRTSSSKICTTIEQTVKCVNECMPLYFELHEHMLQAKLIDEINNI